jgi:hypothetical protein
LGVTTHYALRYPALSDTPDGATQIENLATDTDAALYAAIVAGRPLRQRIALGNHNQPVTSTTPQNVPDLAAAVGTGTYRVTGHLIMTTGAAAGAMDVRINGPSISEGETWGRWRQANTTSDVTGQTDGTSQDAGTTSVNAYNTGAMTSPAMPSSGIVYSLEIDCSFTFSAAGTIHLVVAESNAGDTWTLDYGWWEVSQG